MSSIEEFFGSKPVSESILVALETKNFNQVFAQREDLEAVLPSRLAKFRPDISGTRFEATICPAQLDDNSWIVLVTPEYRNAEVVETIQEKVCAVAGLKSLPSVFCVNPSLLLAVRSQMFANGERERTKEETTIHKAAFHEIIAWGIRNNASDVHFNVMTGEQSSQVRFHINSIYVKPDRWVMQTDRMQEILQVAWQDGKGRASPIFNGKTEGQCSIHAVVDSTEVVGRWATMAADRGPSVTLRLLKTNEETVSKTFSQHGYLPSEIEMLDRAQNAEGGAIVFSGVVNSGKSTSLATLMNGIPDTRKKGSLEDPVEYRMSQVIQNTVSRSLDTSEQDPFEAKLMMFKRGAYQDIMFGEVRDKKGGLAIMEMVGMGTNCYTSVHARSVLQIPERLSSDNIGIPLDFLSSPGNLTLMVYQALLPVTCQHCARPLSSLAEDGGLDIKGREQSSEYWERYIDRIQSIYKIDTKNVKIRDHEGCEQCRHIEVKELNGFKGRSVISELKEPNTDRKYLRYVKNNDFLSAQEHSENLERSAIDDPDMTNKSIMENAVYKMLQGTFDPRIVEARTTSFATIELVKRNAGLLK
jgi:type II secretory ATPase GspE/PulE/Tfp pilus assembly ATPase PilB-like protein